MKEVAILLLLALATALIGCGSSSTAVQTPSTAIWAAVLSNGTGADPDPSFNTQFTLNSDGSLTITFFQFLTQQSCFPISGETVTGQTVLTVNSSDFAVTGTLAFTVGSGGSTLTLNGTSVTGTELGTTLTNGLVTGTWSETNATTPACNATGSFTMSQCISGSCTPVP